MLIIVVNLQRLLSGDAYSSDAHYLHNRKEF